MNRILFLLLTSTLLLAACAGAPAAPAANQPEPSEPAQPAPASPQPATPTPAGTRPCCAPTFTARLTQAATATPDARAAVQAARQFIAAQLNVDIKTVLPGEVYFVTWPDSCLGAALQDEMCAEVITPGWLGVVDVDGVQYEYHANADGSAVRLLPPAVLRARLALLSLTTLRFEEIFLISFEAVEWRDSCLGIHTPGVGCLDVITPGYLVLFSTPLGGYEYHTDESGRFVKLAAGPLP